MNAKNTALQTKLEINRRILRNRYAVAPMTRVSATENGLATENMVNYYKRFAKGGFGLIITEGIYTDSLFSQGYPFQPGISNVEQALAWKPVVDNIHTYRSLVFAQLMHAGALNQGNRFTQHSVAPSAIQPKGKQMTFYYGEGEYGTPHAISDTEISDVIDGFVSAAVASKQIAGFDGIEVHGANGYLLDQFMTDYTNTRTDKWGGDTKARLGLTLDIFNNIRKAVGDDYPVGVRISQGKVNDFTHKWAGAEQDAEIIFGSLADAGVDFIHVTEFEAWKPAFGGEGDSLVALAKRYAPKIKIIANGGLHDPDRAVEVLEQGADIIAIGKGALSNPDLPTRMILGNPLNEISTEMLAPIANLKDYELHL